MKAFVLSAVSASLFSLSALAAPLESTQVAENISVIRTDSVDLHTYQGISNSHIIETENELRIVDVQMTFPEAKAVRAYAEGLGKPIAAVILSHNHPDHWFGAEVFKDIPVLTSANVISDLKTGGMRYINLMKERMGDVIPSEVFVPSGEIALGAHTWDGLDVIIEEHPDQEAHHSILVKIPEAGVIIGQDLFYNNRFLVASERQRNRNWRDLLAGFLENEMQDYHTLLVGHGANGGKEILELDIAYLDALEEVMEMDLGKEETKAEMIKRFPDMKGEGLLDISMRNLHSHDH